MYCGSVSDIRSVSTLCDSNPGFTARNFMNERISSEAPTSSTSASATSTTTRIERVLFWRKPLPDRPLLSLSVRLRSTRDAWSAGNRPKTTPVTSDTAMVNATTRQSAVTPEPSAPMRGMLPGFTASSARMPVTPRASPSVPPTADNITFSVSSWRTIRPRPAPIAARMAISRFLAVARTSSRFATLAHAISSTKLTAPTSTKSEVRTLRTRRSCISCTPKLPFGPSCCGNLARNCSAAACICAFALASVTPGFSRAAAVK